jgi:hypothetical protein
VQYMLLIYSDEAAWDSSFDDETRKAVYAEYTAFTNDLREQGKLVSADELQPSSTATSIRVRDGESLVTDGPFADTKEVLGGYYLIEADSLDEALEWAARIPSARHGTIEVRPIVMRRAEVEA